MKSLTLLLFIGKWLRKYAVLIALLLTFGIKVGSSLLYGMPPVTQLPPSGYEVEQGVVTLQWNRGDIEEPITLQISKDKNFEEIVFDQEVSGITYQYRENLERGQTYYWRLMQNEQEASRSKFIISPQHVNL